MSNNLFTPWKIKNLELNNRIVMAPMCQYASDDSGKPSHWHTLHYSTRAVGGVGLIIVESTAINRIGRITNKDIGIWDDEQIEHFLKITNAVHQYDGKIALQIFHAGRKCECSKDIVAPSAIPFNNEYPIPKELSKEEINNIIDDFKQAARRAKEANFDAIEIHGAHGYLISQFLSPISNQRKDEYGINRAKFLEEVLVGVKEVLPADFPILLRISADDYVYGGNKPNDFISLLSPIKHLFDCLDISTGGTVGGVILDENTTIAPGYQTKACEIIKSGLKDKLCISGGLIKDPDMANEMILNDRCDGVFIGRELLRNPYWPLQASLKLGIDFKWPHSYSFAK